MSNDHSDEGFYAPKRGSSTYLSVRGDAFVESVKEGTEHAVSRENKMGNMVWELLHEGGFKGQLRGVYLPEPKNNYGRQMCLRFKTKTIQVSLSSMYFKKFVQVCQNIDLNEPLIIVPYKLQKTDLKTNKKIPGKFISGWTLYQGGDDKENKLESTINSGRDGDVPEMVKTRIKGEDVWDDSEQIDFYVEKLTEWLEEEEEYFAQFKTQKEEPEEEEEEEDEPTPPKKAVKKVVKKKKPAEDEEEDDDNVPY